MGKPLINPTILYEYEPLNPTVVDDIFDYVMSLIIDEDPGILEDIDV